MDFFYTEGYSDYSKFPMHYLNVTQGYDEGNHLDHWKNANYVDYPIDLGGMDSGRDYLYAPVDMRVVKINGINNKDVSNKIFLESINLVNTPRYGKVKIFMTAVHFEDSDIEKFNLYEGKIIKEGEPICFEGKETATANHLHITCGIGSASKSIKNKNEKWVTLGDCKKPEDIFYIDSNFTKIKNMRGLKFEILPMIDEIKKIGFPVERDISKNQIEILVDTLKIRDDYSLEGNILGYINKGIYDYTEVKVNDYVWYRINDGWIYVSENMIKVYEKEELDEDINSEEVLEIIFKEKSWFKIIFNKLKEIIKFIFK